MKALGTGSSPKFIEALLERISWCFEHINCITKQIYSIEKAEILAVKVNFYGHHKYVIEQYHHSSKNTILI